MTLPQWFRNLLTPGIGVKRWLILLFVGLLATAFGFALGILRLMRLRDMLINTALETGWLEIALITLVGGIAVMVGFLKLSRSLLAPYRRHMPTPVLDAVVSHSRRNKGMRVVAIGGGTGMPSVLRGLKAFTSNMTAVVTVADDGGSSGRLRREFGVLPPGDLRNNIAALADDESLMTQLFQYRFSKGDLGGHAFGNLFITALSGVTGSLETALVETERVLNIQGRVLPATLEEVTLTADILLLDSSQAITVRGESQISEAGGRIVHIGILPERVEAFAAFEAAGRDEQADKEDYELEILEGFMPEPLSEDELDEIVDDVIAEVGATSLRDIGRVMADVMPRISGRADGSAVSQIVREKLA